jgi:hypothetical protein
MILGRAGQTGTSRTSIARSSKNSRTSTKIRSFDYLWNLPAMRSLPFAPVLALARVVGEQRKECLLLPTSFLMEVFAG